MQTAGIKRKVVTKGKQYDEHAKRYVWYPMHALDLANSQGQCPVWNPKIPKGRIILLESFEYKTQVVDESEQGVGYNGVTLGDRTMGTDAQVNFLMGNSDGTGYMDKGMSYLQSVTEVDPDTVSEIEQLILPNVNGEIVIPDTLLQMRLHLATVKWSRDLPIADLATLVKREMEDGIARAIRYCESYTRQLEKELREGQSGKIGIKELSLTHQYYFRQIDKPLPEDRVGVNMGAELRKALAPLIGGQGQTQAADSPTDFQKDIEMEAMQRKIAELEADNAQQAEVITALTIPTEEAPE
jgi:hypothetical protein